MKKINIKFTILAVIGIIIFAVAVSPVGLQNDTFYTIAIGDYILDNGITLEANDPFTWHENIKYTFPHWAYDVFIFLVYNLGGMLGIYISTCVLTAILGLTIYFTHNAIYKNRVIAFFLSLFALYAMQGYFAARAQLVTFIFFVLQVLFIEKFLATKKKRYGIGLILIAIVIANIHTAVWPFYFVLFIPYIADYLFNKFIINLNISVYNSEIKKINKKISKANGDETKILVLNEKLTKYYERLNKAISNKQKRDYLSHKVHFEKNENGKWLIVIFILCAFTGFVTPIGDTPYTYLIKTMEGTTTQNISEHLPLTIAQNLNYAIFFGIVVLLAVFAKVKMKLSDWFMIIGLMILAFMSRRQISMVYLIALIPIGKMLANFIMKYDKDGTKDVIKFMTTFLGTALTLAIVILMSLVEVRPKVDDVFISESSYPVKAADYIVENMNLEEMKLFNEYNYGSYLLYRGIPVFIDSRADLYAPEFNEGINVFDDFISTTGLTNYEEIFEKYGITHIILYDNAKLNLFLEDDENYNIIYSDSDFKLYERLNVEEKIEE